MGPGQRTWGRRGPPRSPSIVHLTSVHRPDDTRIYVKEASTLAAAGFRVTVVATTLPARPSPNVRFLGLAAPRNRVHRMISTGPRLWRAALQQRPDAVHVHDPELLPMAGVARLASRVRVVYDAHEELPKQILRKEYLPPRLRRVISVLAAIAQGVGIRAADAVVAATPAIARSLSHPDVTVVQNFPLPDEFAMPGAAPYRSRERVVAYVGGATADRGIRELIDAVRHLPAALGVRLSIAGTVTPPALAKEIAEGSDGDVVELLGWLSRDEVAGLLGRARLGVVTFHPVPNHVEAYPNKLFEYLSAGIPVVASDFPLWREIVDGAKAGLLVDPRDPRAIAGAIRWLIEHEDEAEAMGRRGRQAVLERFHWSPEGRKLVNLYRRLLGEPAGTHAGG